MWFRFLAILGLLSAATCSNSEAAGELAEVHNVHEHYSSPIHSETEHLHEDQNLVASTEQPSPSMTAETSFSNCLIFAVADNLKEHLTTDNVKPVTVLLQHSIQTCPGLNSTFEVFQKIMAFKGLDFAGVMNFIGSLKVHNGTTTPDVDVVKEDEQQQIEQTEEPTTEMPSVETTENFVEDENDNVQENDSADNIESDDTGDSEEALETNQETIGENYEDAIPASSEFSNEVPNPSLEDHKAEYRKFWNEERLNNLREAQYRSNEMI